jgi:hypothetical protein
LEKRWVEDWARKRSGARENDGDRLCSHAECEQKDCGTEAIRLMVNYPFATEKVVRIQASIDTENTPLRKPWKELVSSTKE